MTITAEQLAWENCTCDWCGSSETALIFEGPDRLERLPGQFRMVRCLQCGLCRQDPRLVWDSLVHYYPEEYASHPRLVRHEPTRWRRLDKRYGPWKRLRAVERFQQGGKLLEVGCGTGLFLEEALRSGHWDVVGIEPSEYAANYARENLKVPIYQNLFGEVDLPEKSFDVIVMWNVVEHLAHPVEDLKYARRLLKDNGWLIFAVPNLESLEARVSGKYWVGWDLPRHLYIFPRKTLKDILGALGYRWAASRCLSTSYSVLGHTINFWSQSWEKKYPRLQKMLLRAYYSFIIRALLIPPLSILDRLNLSTIITVFAQKTPEQDK